MLPYISTVEPLNRKLKFLVVFELIVGLSELKLLMCMYMWKRWFVWMILDIAYESVNLIIEKSFGLWSFSREINKCSSVKSLFLEKFDYCTQSWK